MNRFARLTSVLLAVVLISGPVAGPAIAAEKRADVVGEADIQAQLDQQTDRQAADRLTVQSLLSRSDVRKIAGTVGIDIKRVEAAAGMLSPSEMEQVAARANEATVVTGGVERVTLTVTTIIIILLLIIILAD